LPSGDQRGLLDSVLGDVHRAGADEPSVGATQTSLCRLLSASTTRVTVIATRFPSGDTAGALTDVTRYQSRSDIARPCATSDAGITAPTHTRDQRNVRIGEKLEVGPRRREMWRSDMWRCDMWRCAFGGAFVKTLQATQHDRNVMCRTLALSPPAASTPPCATVTACVASQTCRGVGRKSAVPSPSAGMLCKRVVLEHRSIRPQSHPVTQEVINCLVLYPSPARPGHTIS
jgi:hypothetical protein